MRLTPEQQKEVERLMPMARALARKWHVEDAQSVAYLALCQAALSFDPSRGASFDTHAYRWVHTRLSNKARSRDRRNRNVVLMSDMDNFEITED